MRWEGQMTCMEKKGKAHTFWYENVKERDHQEDLDVDVNTMLEYMLKK
jgi:hypothetical protein